MILKKKRDCLKNYTSLEGGFGTAFGILTDNLALGIGVGLSQGIVDSFYYKI